MKKPLALTAALLAAGAWASDPVVPVQADVVHASLAPGQVEPDLVAMQKKLAEQRRYQAMRKVLSKRIELVQGKAEALELPNSSTAELTLQGVKDNVATVKLKVPPTETVYSLARGRSIFVQGGAHDGGDLWLVVSQPK